MAAPDDEGRRFLLEYGRVSEACWHCFIPKNVPVKRWRPTRPCPGEPRRRWACPPSAWSVSSSPPAPSSTTVPTPGEHQSCALMREPSAPRTLARTTWLCLMAPPCAPPQPPHNDQPRQQGCLLGRLRLLRRRGQDPPPPGCLVPLGLHDEARHLRRRDDLL